MGKKKNRGKKNSSNAAPKQQQQQPSKNAEPAKIKQEVPHEELQQKQPLAPQPCPGAPVQQQHIPPQHLVCPLTDSHQGGSFSGGKPSSPFDPFGAFNPDPVIAAKQKALILQQLQQHSIHSQPPGMLPTAQQLQHGSESACPMAGQLQVRWQGHHC